jgi:hypothetical protein
MKARTRLALAALGVLATLTLGSFSLGSFAWASIPDSGGTIHGCYDKVSGALRVSDRDTGTPKNCTAKELALDWSKGSPAGDAYLARFGTNVGTAQLGTTPCTLGEIRLSAGRVTAGGVPATGQLMSIGQNVALFSLLGVTYGGNGQTTFALPDLRPIPPNGMTYSICTEGTWPVQ